MAHVGQAQLCRAISATTEVEEPAEKPAEGEADVALRRVVTFGVEKRTLGLLRKWIGS